MESIFDLVSDKFFNPLCGKSRRIYLDCISLLVEETKKPGSAGAVLYEKGIKDILTIYLKNLGDNVPIDCESDGGEDNGTTKTPQERATDILAYFRSCGWVTTDIGRNGTNIISISPYCIDLVSALQGIYKNSANNDTNELRKFLHSMRETLSSPGRQSSLYRLVLKDLLETKRAFENRLVALRESIRIIMQSLRGKESVGELAKHMASGDFSTSFFPEFYTLQEHGKAPQYISEIAQKLRILQRDDDKYGSIVRECSMVEHLTIERAEEKVDHIFQELFRFLNSGYEEETDYISELLVTEVTSFLSP